MKTDSYVQCCFQPFPSPENLIPAFQNPCPQISMLWDMTCIDDFLDESQRRPKTRIYFEIMGSRGKSKTGIKFSGELVSSTLNFGKELISYCKNLVTLVS